MNVAVVLPAYNEEGNLAPLITELRTLQADDDLALSVIVVDDGSTDGTARELEQLQQGGAPVEIVRHASNQGLAQAIKTGIGAAAARRYDAMVFMDSDLSHRPSDLPALVRALDIGADVALGSRFIPGGAMVGVPMWRVAVSRFGNLFGRLVLGIPVADLTTGYRAFRRQVFEKIVLGEDGFTIQLESAVKAYAAGFRVVEVPIVLGTRRHGQSHMTYSLRLFRDYWRLLQACRSWMRDAARA